MATGPHISGNRRDRIRVFSALTILLSARLVALPLGLDRLTTLTWMAPVPICIAVGSGLLASFLVAREILVRTITTAESVAAKHAEGNVNRTGFLRGILLVLMIGFAIFYLIGTLLGIGAQHLRGTAYEADGIVASLKHNYSARNPCLLKVIATSAVDDNQWKFCLQTAHGDAIAPSDLEIGDGIRLRVRDTALGTVIESASRVR